MRRSHVLLSRWVWGLTLVADGLVLARMIIGAEMLAAVATLAFILLTFISPWFSHRK